MATETFLERAALWASLARVAGAKWQEVLGWAWGGAVGERVLGVRLADELNQWYER